MRILYANYTCQCLRAKETEVPKPKPNRSKKVLLSVCYGINTIISRQILPSVQSKLTFTVNNWMILHLDGRRMKVYVLHDNVRPHTTKVNREKNISNGRTPYSPDLMPSNFHFFLFICPHVHDKKIYKCNKEPNGKYFVFTNALAIVDIRR